MKTFVFLYSGGAMADGEEAQKKALKEWDTLFQEGWKRDGRPG